MGSCGGEQRALARLHAGLQAEDLCVHLARRRAHRRSSPPTSFCSKRCSKGGGLGFRSPGTTAPSLSLALTGGLKTKSASNRRPAPSNRWRATECDCRICLTCRTGARAFQTLKPDTLRAARRGTDPACEASIFVRRQCGAVLSWVQPPALTGRPLAVAFRHLKMSGGTLAEHYRALASCRPS
jgi:hypothetical protein